MYPISFDNPNQRQGRPKAANRNIADGDLTSLETCPETGNGVAFGAEETPENTPETTRENTGPSSLLVVECRRDDKWRVELCTDLSELDAAMDMARGLRGSPDVDEVCLTLEVSGAYGRESRREVLRFGAEMQESQYVPRVASPSIVGGPVPVRDQTVDDTIADGLAVLNASLKMPDYDMPDCDMIDLDFSEFTMPEPPVVNTVVPIRTETVDDAAREQFTAEDPINIGALSGTFSGEREPDRDAARSLLSSIYGNVPEPAEEDAIRVKIPSTRPHQNKHQDHADWLYRTQSSSERHQAQRLRLEATDDDLDDGVVDRFEIPLFTQQNGLAGKLLVFAGTIALLVLGGALAELLAVDITTTANAGVGAFDTFSSVSNNLLR